MKKIKIDRLRWEKENALFPDQITNDDSILYHGTSSINERRIDSAGFSASQQIFSKENILSLIKSYLRMGWNGASGGGFAVLGSFSKWDHSRSEGSPIFFTHDPVKCLTFTDKDFSGGEKVRAVRYCGEDLKKILTDDDVYAKYKNDFEKWKHSIISNAQQMGLAANEVRLRSRDEVDAIYNSHQNLWQLANNAFSEHQYGIVYAVKFDENTAKDLRNGGSMGILSFADVLPSQILCKVVVDDEIQKSRHVSDNVKKLLKWHDSNFYKKITNVN